MIFNPDIPYPHARIYLILKEIGHAPDLLHRYDMRLYREQGNYDINKNCIDVSKTHVDKCFADIFGYSSFINPEKYIGKYVKKTEEQATKSGIIFTVNQEKEHGYIYQKYLDTYNNGSYNEYRVHIINGNVVWIRHKIKKDWIKASLIKSFPDKLSNQLIKKIEIFADRFGVDFCEIDLLFDNGIPYIIDVNDMPGVMPWEYIMYEFKREIKILADKYKTYWL